MFVLDSDILTLLFYGQEKITRKVEASGLDRLSISIVSKVEVLRGRFDSLLKAANGPELVKAQRLLQRTWDFLDQFPVLMVEDQAVALFDHWQAAMATRKMGRADLLIACIVQAKGATLVTRNLRHFRLIPGLQLENWVD